MATNQQRTSGVLIHLTSLPVSPEGGAVGSQARGFVDRLAAAGQSVWQMLPVHPPDPFDSPYSSPSAFAGHPRLAGSGESAPDPEELAAWRARNADWVEDWALFDAIRAERGGAPWTRWPAALRNRDPGALDDFAREHADRVERAVVAQFHFDTAWDGLRAHARTRGVKLFGDMPFFVAMDSADVWANPRLFNLTRDGRPTHVAGVPPDYFSRNGQRWGNPLYAWEEHAADGYRWWRRRLEVTLRRFDMVRIDHFRAIDQNWAIPRRNRTARKGRWVDGPGRALLGALQAVAGPGGLVAEDLGTITPAVFALRREFDIPGMVVLQFGFEGGVEDNPHHPDNVSEDVVCYTGTHDNNTTLGWYLEDEKRRERRVKPFAHAGEQPHQTLHRLAMESPARLAVVPIQDLLGLDASARMNFPGRVEGNWKWRLRPGQLDAIDWKQLKQLTAKTGRLP